MSDIREKRGMDVWEVHSTVALVCLGLVFATGSVLAQSDGNSLRDDLNFARAKVYPALVNISVVAKTYSGGRTVRFPAAGSGVVVSPAGHVITNYHVTENAARIVCTLPSGEAIAADIVADDAPVDLSILKLRLETRRDLSKPLTFATLGDSDALNVGDYVLAVGNPLTLSSSMTLGIVSNTRRVFTNFTGTEIEDLEFGSGNRTGMFTQWIQHDALILPGNSGGPLVNLRGEIVGINTRGGAGVGFASPSNLVSKILNQVLTIGKVRRGWLGATVLPVAKLGRDSGALVASVVPSSPADEAGIEPGDVLLTFDGQPIVTRFFEEVPLYHQRVAEMEPGKKVSIAFHRGRDEKTVTATVAPMEEFVGKEVELRRLGITVQDITGPMALARRYPSDEGVVVTSLRPGLPAETARPRIVAGDVVLALAGEPVKDLDSFLKAVEGVGDRQEVPVSYRRDHEHILTVIDLEEKERSKPGGELPKAWLGVKTQVLTPPVAKALGVGEAKGFRVTEVFPWTAANTAGLEAGDVITAIDDEKLEAFRAQDAKDLQRAVEEFSVGEEVELAILRDGKTVKIAVTLEESPTSAADVKKEKNDLLEVTVREVTFDDRLRYRWDKEQKGVLVVECTSGGWAAMGGLRPNDLVVRINDREISGLESFRSVLEAVEAEKPAVVSFFLRRGYRTTFVFVEPDWSSTAAAQK